MNIFWIHEQHIHNPVTAAASIQSCALYIFATSHQFSPTQPPSRNHQTKLSLPAAAFTVEDEIGFDSTVYVSGSLATWEAPLRESGRLSHQWGRKFVSDTENSGRQVRSKSVIKWKAGTVTRLLVLLNKKTIYWCHHFIHQIQKI